MMEEQDTIREIIDGIDLPEQTTQNELWDSMRTVNAMAENKSPNRQNREKSVMLMKFGGMLAGLAACFAIVLYVFPGMTQQFDSEKDMSSNSGGISPQAQFDEGHFDALSKRSALAPQNFATDIETDNAQELDFEPLSLNTYMETDESDGSDDAVKDFMRTEESDEYSELEQMSPGFAPDTMVPTEEFITGKQSPSKGGGIDLLSPFEPIFEFIEMVLRKIF